MKLRGWSVLLGVLCGAVRPDPAFAQRRQTVVDVQVAPPEAQLQVGHTQPFLATAYDNVGNPIASASFIWRSTNPRAATVDRNGIATAVAPGATTITARTGVGSRAKVGRANLVVIAAGAAPQPPAQPGGAPQPAGARVGTGGRPAGAGCAAWERQPEGTGAAEGLIFNPLRLTLVRGESAQLDYRAVRSDGANAERVCIEFAVEAGGERIAAVDSFGVVLAVSDTGHAVIRAAVPGRSGALVKQISVDVRGDGVGFERSEISIAPGAVDTLAMVVPAEHRRLNPFGIFQFVTTDTATIRVSPVAPVVHAMQAGTARVLAQSSLYPEIPITVNVHRPVARLIGTPDDTLLTLALGGTDSLGARALASDSSPIPEVPLRWTQTDTSVAWLDVATGRLHALRLGDARVAVSAPSGRDSSTVRRWHVRVVAGGLAIAHAQLALGLGQRVPIAVQLLDERRQPVGPATQLTWTSTDDSVARFEGGQIVAAGMGHAVLTGRAPWDSTVSADVYVIGDLLVSGFRDGRWDLYMLARGSPPAVRALTGDSALETQPAWAPDLRQIAYVAAAGPGSSVFDLWVANADGSGQRRLTSDSASVRSPSYVRPSGDSIVFESGRGGRQQLYVIGTDGSGRRQLTDGDEPHSQPDASPDGRKVLFVSLRSQNYDVYEMSFDGTGERRLTTSSRPEDSPAYAPDGRSFFFLRDEGGRPPAKRVYREDLATLAAAPITPPGVFVQAYSLGPDGRTMALTILQADARGVQTVRVATFDLATGALTPLTLPGASRLGGTAFRPAIPPGP